MKNMAINLLFPPFATTLNTPPVGLSALYPFIRQHGYDISATDMNIEFFDYLLRNWNEIKEIIYEYKVQLYRNKNTTDRQTDKFISITLPLVENLQNTQTGIKAEDLSVPNHLPYRSPRLLHKCMRDLVNAYLFGNLFLDGDYLNTSIEQISKQIARCKNNPIFQQFFSQYTWNKPTLVGFSILAETQLPFAMLLSQIFKEKFPSIITVAGGSYITEIADNMASEGKIFDYFDHMVVHEGESALLSIIDSIENKSKIKHPNIFSRNRRKNESPFIIEDIETLPEQDFSCFNLNHYRRWGLNLPVYSSKGCTWARCAFCNINFLKYREKNIEDFIDAVFRLTKRYETKQIQLVDEDVRPERLARMAQLLLQKKENKLHWMIQTRFYKGLNFELLKKMKQAGFETIEFGLESVNPKTISKIRKGISLEHVHRILSDCEKNDYKVILNFMVGFPWESETEANMAIEFIDSILEKYPSLQVSCNTQKVKIYVNSDFHKNPDRYNITSFKRLPLSTILSWRPPDWVDGFIKKNKNHLLFSMESKKNADQVPDFSNLTDDPYLTIAPSWYHLSASEERYKSLGLTRCLLVRAISTSWEAIHINETMDAILSELTLPSRLSEMKKRVIEKFSKYEASDIGKVFGNALVKLNEMGAMVFYES